MSQRNKPDRFGVHPDNVPASLRYNQTAHEFTFAGHQYRCNGLSPLEQIHMARRLAPVILSAIKPEGGRKAILSRLAKLASLATAGDGVEAPIPDDAVDGALDLANSILEAAAATNEESLNVIIRKCGSKIARVNDSGGMMFIWDDKADLPLYRDLDGFKVLALVSRYLFFEFRDSIGDYIRSLDLKPGPALMAAAGRAAGAPEAP